MKELENIVIGKSSIPALVITVVLMIAIPVVFFIYWRVKHREQTGISWLIAGAVGSHKTISEEDLREVPLLLTGHECNFRHMLVTDLEENGISPKIVLETSSKEILKQFAAGGY
ncbi:MAG: LysR family transcriptional regulator substrate-binding protein [Lachnospiraceae bacterium]|nr:LysR family transcriptional regulator substrate-binding protein [Lachnospiraceae bacterium]